MTEVINILVGKTALMAWLIFIPQNVVIMCRLNFRQ